MDQYHIWCDLRDPKQDLLFVQRVQAWLDGLRDEARIADYRISRRKLGLGAPHLGEFHVLVETEDLAQLDRAFEAAAARSGPHQDRHAAVYSMVTDPTFALYRDFPDPVRDSDAPSPHA